MKQRLENTFTDLIKINEVYPNEDKIIEYVENRLTKESVSWQEDGFRNIIAKIPGVGEPLMLCTHLDIPESAPDVKYEKENGILRSAGNGILGADPKSGLAVLIELLIDLNKTNPKTHVPVEVVLTRGEETGLFGARNLDYSLVQSKMGIVLDEDGPVTNIVTQAPAYVRVDATVIGKAAHPRDPNDGINALKVACETLVKIPWGYSTKGVTWNVGLLSSGTARNTIPGSVEIKAELRSFDTALVVKEGEKIDRIFMDVCDSHGASCNFVQELEFDGYKLEKTHPLFKKLEKTFETLKLIPNFYPTFGGSDANIFNSQGITTISIGSGYYNAHQYSEYVNLNDMVEIVEFLKAFLKRNT